MAIWPHVYKQTHLRSNTKLADTQIGILINNLTETYKLNLLNMLGYNHTYVGMTQSAQIYFASTY